MYMRLNSYVLKKKSWCSIFMIENSHQCVVECPKNTDILFRDGVQGIGWVCVYRDEDKIIAKGLSRNGVVTIVLTVMVSFTSIGVVIVFVFKRRCASSRLSRVLGNRKFFSKDRGNKIFDDDCGIGQVGEEFCNQKLLNLRRKKPVILEILDKAKNIEQDKTNSNRIEREVSLGLISILQLLEEHEKKLKITNTSLTPGMIARLMSWGEQVVASYENLSLLSKDDNGGSLQSIKDKPLRIIEVPHCYSKEPALNFVTKMDDQFNFPSTDL